MIDRRTFLGSTLATGTLASFTRAKATPAGGLKISICDWNLGPSCDPAMIEKAAQAGLKGIQVSVGTAPDRIVLREPAMRKQYQELGKRHGIAFNSVAAGSILNSIPLKSEPQSAVYVIDAVETAAVLGAPNVLIAFFGNGDLRLTDARGELRNLNRDGFAAYELDSVGVTRVVEVLRQLVPRAEDKGVILGLENTLTAEQNLEIIDRIGSKMVQVYYDVGNSTHYGYDVPTEIRRLGKQQICEIHLKDWETPLLGTGGEVDFPAAAAACREIGFDLWYTLETSGRENWFMEDTKANIEYVTRLFGTA